VNTLPPVQHTTFALLCHLPVNISLPICELLQVQWIWVMEPWRF